MNPPHASLAPHIPAHERGVLALLCTESIPARTRRWSEMQFAVFHQDFCTETADGRWGMSSFSLVQPLELFSGPAASVPGKEPLPTAAPAETSPLSPCTPPTACRGARAALLPPPPPVTPISHFPWQISRLVWGVVLNYNMQIRKWKKKSFLSQSRTEKILRYAKEIRRRAVYSLGGMRPAFEADKSLLVIQYLNQN